ncbi:hypothetical protein EG832_07660, partial [bacterium]|nr:hypothetical protein [bacterium]
MRREVNMHSMADILKRINTPSIWLGRQYDDHFNNVSTVENADRDSLIFINKPDKNTFETLKRPYAVALLEQDWGMKNQVALNEIHAALFLVKRPRLIIARILKLLHPDEDRFGVGIHPTAAVHPNARIHPSVSIGRHCIIEMCEIGENSRIEAHTIIKNNVVIGKNVIIREYCLVGGCGFGFVRDEFDRPLRIPHIG